MVLIAKGIIMNKTVTKIVGKVDSNKSINNKVIVTNQQLLILYRIYRYRFVNTYQLQQLLEKKQIQQVQQRLNLLLVRGWIGKNYSSHDRLTGKYATYYLLPKGLKILKLYKARIGPNFEPNPRLIHNIYKDRSASTRFINHCIGAGDINLGLRRLYHGSLEYFPKSELLDYDYFPELRPDAYLRIGANIKKLNQCSEYLLEYCNDIIPFFVLRNIIKQYVEYVDRDTWHEATNRQMPVVLLVAESPVLQRRLQRFIRKLLNSTYVDTKFWLTSKAEIVAATDGIVWLEIGEDENIAKAIV